MVAGILIVGGMLGLLLFAAHKTKGQYIDFTEGYEPTPPKVETPPSIDAMIVYAANKHRVEAALVKAVAMTESSLNPRAKNPADPSYGLMQIMPILAEDYGIVKDYHNPTEAEIAMIYDPQTNLLIGAWFLSNLLKRHSLQVAVEMYNVGETGWNKGRRNPEYVSRVMRYYNGFRNNTIG